MECRTPSPGKAPVTIDAWKFEVVRRAVLSALADHPMGVPFADLAPMVAKLLTSDELARLGSVSWYVTTVKLELEVRGEIARTARRSPQTLTRVRSDVSPRMP